MIIKYNEDERSIEIKDGLRTPYLVLKIIMIMNILIAIMNLAKSGFNQLEVLGYLYMAVGIASSGVLFFLQFKKSTKEKVPLNEIDRFREKSFFGKSVFSLELKNGKVRDLTSIKSKSDIKELKNLFSEIGLNPVRD